MKIKWGLIVLCFLCTLGLTSCTGYNNIMYEHLSDIENYKIYEAKIEQIYIFNDETKKFEEYNSAVPGESSAGAVYFDISTEDTNSLIRLKVTADNNKLLLDNGFYNDFQIGDSVEMQASDWIYMDTDFFYVIGVTYEGVQYLSSADGLKNIVDMMDDDRSLF